MPLSTDQIKQLSKHLDEVLALPKSDWHAWVERTRGDSDVARSKVRALLESGDMARTLSEDALKLPLPRGKDWQGLAPTHVALGAGDAVGPYRLLRQISEGGMASVWLAERADGAYRRRVALKLPYAGAHAAALAKRFEVERDILALLEHKNIARFYDAGSANGIPFIALEYVVGKPITQFCDDAKLDVTARIQLFRQVLQAVQYAHSHLIIHRDLKPNNVLVDEEGNVKLLDFGIAQLLEREADAAQREVDPITLHHERAPATTPQNTAHANADDSASRLPAPTQSGDTTQGEITQVFGRVMTPRYASPEQILGEPVTTASDVYSLGVLLYRLLAQCSPYELKADGARRELALIRDQIVRGDLTPISARRINGKRLSRELSAIIDKALSRNAESRYVTANAFDADLARYLQRVPVTARKQSDFNRLRLFFRRQWIPSAAVAFMFVSVSVLAGYLYRESEIQRRTKAFLLQVLTPTTYYADGGRLLTQPEMLMRAADSVEKTFADQPRVQAEVYQAVGESLFNLGEHEQAFQVRTHAQPIIDAAFGRTSREAIRNASRATYMHLTQRRLDPFKTSLADLESRCPSLKSVPEDKCFGIVWLQTQYFAYTGEGTKRKALWDDYDQRTTQHVAADSRWHTILNYWGAGAARQTGDLQAAKSRWDKLLALQATHDAARGDHMTALSAVAMLRASGYTDEAATLGRDLYAQGVRYMGDAFDQRLFYIPGVAEAQAAAGVDYGAEAQLREGIAKVRAHAVSRGDPLIEREAADALAALGLVLIAKGRFDEAAHELDTAIRLQSTFDVVHDSHLLEMKTHRLVVAALLAKTQPKSEQTGLYAQSAQTLSEWRRKAESNGDSSSLPRIDALLAVFDPQNQNTHWQRAQSALLRTHARPHDTTILLRALGANLALPPPASDASIDSIRDFARKVLDVTEVALAQQRTVKKN